MCLECGCMGQQGLRGKPFRPANGDHGVLLKERLHAT